MPPDKNIEPSVKIAAVGGGKDHSSVVECDPGSPPKEKASVDVPVPAAYPFAVAKSFTSVQAVPFQSSVFVT